MSIVCAQDFSPVRLACACIKAISARTPFGWLEYLTIVWSSVPRLPLVTSHLCWIGFIVSLSL